MLASMTGFGRSVVETPLGRLVVEILSVNRKYFEMYVTLPKELSRFEIEVRKWVGEKVSRGQVSVRVQLSLSAENMGAALPEFEMLKQFKQGFEELAKKLGFDPKTIDLPFLVAHLPQSPKGAFFEKGELSYLQKGVDEALIALVAMKQEEGRALKTDLVKRLKEIAEIVEKVEELAPQSVIKAQERLREKLEGLVKESGEMEERLLREVALFADKVDIAEELTRLRSHIGQFEAFCKAKQAPIGRKMDFLVQEMGREINTIGSKSADAKIAYFVVEMKSELEKMREQIQNIE